VVGAPADHIFGYSLFRMKREDAVGEGADCHTRGASSVRHGRCLSGLLRRRRYRSLIGEGLWEADGSWNRISAKHGDAHRLTAMCLLYGLLLFLRNGFLQQRHYFLGAGPTHEVELQ
jgi:hypothetical protein